MKGITISIMLMAALLTGCSKKAPLEFQTQSISFAEKGDKAEVDINIDFPTLDNELATSVAKYINDLLLHDYYGEMGNGYDGPLSNGLEMAEFYGNSMLDGFIADGKEYEHECNSVYNYNISILEETEDYITYKADMSAYYIGAAHGASAIRNRSFSKYDGQPLGYNMLNMADSTAIRALIIEGLKEYCTKRANEPVESNEQLEDFLLFDGGIDEIPLPKTEPYITTEGMTFVYQQYEIASYAAGMPQFTIAFRDIKPYMTDEAKELIKE